MNAPKIGLERQNLTARISGQLAEELMAGDFMPGQPLVLREVAERFGVSQTPVREALLQLVSEGALAMSPSKSIFVPEVSRALVNELRELRILLECYAARSASQRITPAMITKLKQIHGRMRTAMQERKTREILVLNKQFHMTLYTQADMPTTVVMIRQLWMRMSPYLNYLYKPNFPDPNLVKDGHPHEVVIEGLEKADPDLVQKGVEQDLRYLQQHLADNLDAIFPSDM
ncbi:GntR family transcriptional regulator [Advenella kashmirensis WT001]|uniref:GntR family transcriptional regulator n=1 Tax=Advenella kashmirensis (strain DSM 17095 / LMG 22695 / WT001) TaxID=1036672 RepID=I3U6X6_ADVKW|nr:GntR family transcriptional regulator [Advenella kashmirensis]AFK60764.1 GntR family transcriptional regulator [Advenella kashmirensis WT001]